MPRAALQPDDVAAFRRRLADAAIHLFADLGYDGVTMRAVAAALDVSAMTPYRYVAGKEELFALVRAEAFRRFADRLEQGIERAPQSRVRERLTPYRTARRSSPRPADEREAADDSPQESDAVDRLRRLKRAYVKFAVDEPDAYRIMFELRPPEGKAARELPELQRESRRAFGCLQRCVQLAVDSGDLEGDPLTLAHLLWAGTHGLVSLHLAGRLQQGRTLEQLAAIDHELPTKRKKAR
jgi:AcrR family transcriptional regulator